MKRIAKCLCFAVVGVLVAAFAKSASADEPPKGLMGKKSQLVVDQISGFRVSANGNINYVIEETSKSTTFWLAPSADFFLLDHVSVGGFIEIASTSQSLSTTAGSQTSSRDLPTLTDVAIVPRGGYLFNLGERLAIWPRLGLGFVSQQSSRDIGANTEKRTQSGFLVDLDVGVLYAITDGFFVKAAPQLSFVPAGSNSITTGSVSNSNDASAFQFAVITGVGGYLSL
jgi:hypothetical protein